ncbi:hypothetical protein B0H16DRAFT_1710693 [Mycena metata]|uniref:Uncharacterized protein n=1 Tax=Mycena metata TaxID=1033252 RepID=A0AAD7KA76_9AGAR|nr:hypothetical protein B0H16DRAFT_1710693 [Mycena metata]
MARLTIHIPPLPRPQNHPRRRRTSPRLPHDLTSITPRVASTAIQRLIMSEFRDAGFSGAQPQTIERVEREVVACARQHLSSLNDSTNAHTSTANLSNRSAAIATDLVLACEEFTIAPESLRPTRAKLVRKKKKKMVPPTPILIPARSRSPSPTRLPSDDESVPPAIPATVAGVT